ncbi:hypothetical protein J31TS4_10390 [Paenibacillus sp. J31TS4]|uniref:nucleotidyltransferase family protein n=1 Tax=Paenibacillus sp. J31TS4 TaxID=2807195 RepID=UPI001B1C9DDB|nr:nucleotidyltransferase family protein [Paenibacillus sp. J31TS4]GIP37759.1 hypothetical protein J31TS4_10390 [Paenibacillus sp. J31TS4]
MKALILAAGYATRLYPLTLHTPKALLPIRQGVTILDTIVDKLEALEEISEVCVISNHRYIHAFEGWLRARRPGKTIRLIDDGSEAEEDKRGAIGDLQLAIEQMGVGDELLVVAGDNLFTFGLQDYVAYFHAAGTDCILVREVEDAEELKRIGVAELDEDGRVLSFEEKPERPRSRFGVYALYLYRRETLPLVADYLKEGNNPDAPSHFPEWLYKRRELRAYLAQGAVYDIGTPEAYRHVSRLAAEGLL